LSKHNIILTSPNCPIALPMPNNDQLSCYNTHDIHISWPLTFFIHIQQVHHIMLFIISYIIHIQWLLYYIICDRIVNFLLFFVRWCNINSEWTNFNSLKIDAYFHFSTNKSVTRSTMLMKKLPIYQERCSHKSRRQRAHFSILASFNMQTLKTEWMSQCGPLYRGVKTSDYERSRRQRKHHENTAWCSSFSYL
jgi:hypothetical protein